MVKEELATLVDDYLKPLGFHKKGTSWYKEDPEVITIFSLHRSRFGEIYYATLSALFRVLSQEKRPIFYKSHSSFRGENLGENTNEYLDLEKNINDDIRKKKIEQLINKSLPLLDKMSSISGFKALLKEFNPRLFMVSTEAQKYLGIHIE